MTESTRLNESFFETTKIRLKQTSFLRAFNLLQDGDGVTKYLNIFKSLRLNTNEEFNLSFFETYETENEDWWDNIAYNVYGTPHLWWIIVLFNNIFNPFEELDEGQNLKILKPVYVFTLFKDIDNIREL